MVLTTVTESFFHEELFFFIGKFSIFLRYVFKQIIITPIILEMGGGEYGEKGIGGKEDRENRLGWG